ncbi:MAG: alpha/beta hydrolase, partial [Bacilli bacterium]|nr:alpha/beta hydrolase [Bacilli bacterium]
LGHFKDNKGHEELIEDQKIITKYIEDNFENQLIYIFAHSMGTIITRVLLEEYSTHYHKVVLSGYPNYQSASHLGIFVSNIIKLIKGPKYKSKLLSDLSIGQFNKKITNPKTNVDWVCKNKMVIEEYIKDPYCGIGFTCSAYNDLYHLVVKMHKVKNYKKINKDLRLLMLRGLEDPCVGGDKGAKESRSILARAGFKDIKFIDYPKMRHEILGEENKEQVYNDILNFYQEK